MKSFFRNNQAMRVGLALRQDQFSLIKLKQTAEKRSLESFASIDLPAGSIVDGKVNHHTQVLHAIKKLVDITESHNCVAAISLQASSVINKRITLPSYLNELECETELTTNLAYYFPGIQEELSVDFVRGEYDASENTALLIAARTEQINAYIFAAEQAELKIRVVDVDLYAIARAIYFANRFATSQRIAILDIDTNTAQLIVLLAKKIIFTHQVMIHSDDALAQQLKRALQLFSTATEQSSIEKIFLTGKVDLITHAKQLIEEELLLEAELANPFNYVESEPAISRDVLQRTAPEFLTAFGLTLRSYPRW
ncbi:MAG: pilus assembly protein PilM [Gammaproteobacteria bacterium]